MFWLQKEEDSAGEDAKPGIKARGASGCAGCAIKMSALALSLSTSQAMKQRCLMAELGVHGLVAGRLASEVLCLAATTLKVKRLESV